MVRDTVTEIAGKRARSRIKFLSTRISAFELNTLEQSWLFGTGPLAVVPDYVVIRLVTILEVFTRAWIAKFIDYGEPYITRAAKIVKGNLKIDYVIAQALVGKHVTFGELVSHTVSVNRLEDIENAFSILIDKDLFEAIINIVDRWDVEIKQLPAVPIMDDISAVRSTLAGLFELRHILVHEIPLDRDTRLDNVTEFLKMAIQFVRACEQAFSTLLEGDYPLTQTDMNGRAEDAALDADAELKAVILKLDPIGLNQQFQRVQIAWEEFRTLQSEFRSGIKSPGAGSIAPLVYATEWEALTIERTKEVNRELNDFEGNL